jgi:hypothetical protein
MVERITGRFFLKGEPISEDWLKSVGFKWHPVGHPGHEEKHWLLWLGGAIDDTMTSYEDLGVELGPNAYDDKRRDHSAWFCWLRSDTSHRYSRFLHVRHLRYCDEVIHLVEGLTGLPWKPENHIYGSLKSQRVADYIRAEDGRLDRRMLRENRKWTEAEKDDSRAGALPEDRDRGDGHQWQANLLSASVVRIS